MKRIVLISLLTGAYVYSQSFPQNSAVWLYQYYDDFHNPTSTYELFYMLGDTTINSTSYSKIYNSADQYIAAARDSDRVILFVDSGANFEEPYMDFKDSIGDTLNTFMCGAAAVSMMDSTTIYFGSVRKFLWYHTISMTDGEIIGIEGVGPYHAFNPMFSCVGALSGNFQLICFQESLLNQHYSQWATNCFLSLDEPGAANFAIYPNPTANFINIPITDKNFTVTVFDIYGKQLAVYQNNGLIDVRSLVNGNYYLEIVINNQYTFYKSFIKQ